MNEYLGIPFIEGDTDCFDLLRRFYANELGVVIPNHARPTRWWDYGMDLYNDYCHRYGFKLIDEPPHEWRYGDVILMAVQSEVGNHSAILMEDGQILHHMYGRLSTIEPYRGIWRNTTVGVFRHPDVAITHKEQTVDIRDVL